MTVAKRMAAAIADASLSSATGDLLAARLHENAVRCSRVYSRSYALFLGFAAAFSLAATSDASAISIVGVQIAPDSIAILILPVIAAYFAYRSACVNQFGLMIDRALEEFYKARASSFTDRRLFHLLMHPTTLEAEQAFVNVTERKVARTLSYTWLVIVIIPLFLGPLAWIAWAVWWLATTNSFATLPTWIASGLATLLIVRSGAILIQTHRDL